MLLIYDDHHHLYSDWLIRNFRFFGGWSFKESFGGVYLVFGHFSGLKFRGKVILNFFLRAQTPLLTLLKSQVNYPDHSVTGSLKCRARRAETALCSTRAEHACTLGELYTLLGE